MLVRLIQLSQCTIYTSRALKVTQNATKKIIKKSFKNAGYLFRPCGINYKFTHNKTLKMKKIAFVIALGAFAACGTGKTETAAADSLKIADSIKTADSLKMAMDTTKKDTSKVATDTTKK
jgi:hypothetical protein